MRSPYRPYHPYHPYRPYRPYRPARRPVGPRAQGVQASTEQERERPNGVAEEATLGHGVHMTPSP